MNDIFSRFVYWYMKFYIFKKIKLKLNMYCHSVIYGIKIIKTQLKCIKYV